MRTWDSDTMTKGGDWFHLFIRFAGLRNTPWIRGQKDCHLLINARQAFLRMPRKSRCVFFSVTHGFHVRRGWLYLKFKESGYPLKNVLNILMSVPWPIALGSVRKGYSSCSGWQSVALQDRGRRWMDPIRKKQFQRLNKGVCTYSSVYRIGRLFIESGKKWGTLRLVQ